MKPASASTAPAAAPASQMTLGELRRYLKPRLSEQFFRRHPTRCLFLLIALATLTAHFVLTLNLPPSGLVPWIFWTVSLFISVNTAAFFFFFFHELLHGAILRRGIVERTLALLSGIFILASPTVWRKWHNKHHATTGSTEDPDRARHPEFDDFSDRKTRIHHLFKKFHFRDILSFFVPFGVIIGHHLMMYIEMLTEERTKTTDKAVMTIEYIFVFTAFLTPVVLFGFPTSLLGFYLPVLLGQVICNLYILSNHNTAFLTQKNKPLLNSVSVYLSERIPVTHMGFGRHVEHHIFPEVSHGRLKELSPVLRSVAPDSFVEVNLSKTLIRLYGRKEIHQPISD